jgi:hypothetical protein
VLDYFSASLFALAAAYDVRDMLLRDEFQRSDWRECDDKPAKVALIH